MDITNTGGVASAEIDRVSVRMLPDGRMNRENAAKYLGMSVKTLATWETQGTGPRSIRVGGRRFYFKDDLDRFIRGEAKGRETES